MFAMSLQDKIGRKFSLDSSCYSREEAGLSAKQRKWKHKNRLHPRKAQSLEEAQLEIQELGKDLMRHTSLRTQTIDERGTERPEGAVTRNSFIQHNKTFHKLFREIPETEELTHAFTCALQKEVLYHGKLYVSENYVCFYSSVLLKETRVVLHASAVQAVKKQFTARLVPNALSVHTNKGDKYLFVSLRNRDSCHKLLCSVCPNAEAESGQSSPVMSSGENSINLGKDAASLSADSSQSGADDTPDPPDSVDPDGQWESTMPKLSRNSRTHTDSSASTQRNQDYSSSEDNIDHSWIGTVTEKVKSVLMLRQSANISFILFIYLMLGILLLLSSGYIGLRIVALERQLTSIEALAEFCQESGYVDT
ncbi:hypothetical protein AGOR_G00236790 [Albula goreensis]|uniref:GRAM domain-containing protein n=1 Tax=Albula goreensis TaxID=1534307 RepID=A0A8T3CCH8_9TELE|nr:hypothetical protein AGOR_G00236790 [Albula goreensis]